MDTGVIILGVLAVLFIALVISFVRGGSSKEPDYGREKSRKTTAPSQKLNWLVGKSDSVRGKTFHIGQRTATIGRAVGNFIQIFDDNSSRVHAQFRGTPSRVEVKDMDSSNGTLVNGDELRPDVPRPLSDGDEIKIGDTVFVYRRSGDFEDEALTSQKSVQESQNKKTMAMEGIDFKGDFKAQIEAAMARADGDIDRAAEQLGVDPGVLETLLEPLDQDR